MKTFNENWEELFSNKLNEDEMLHIRGGDGEEDENPTGPIVK